MGESTSNEGSETINGNTSPNRDPHDVTRFKAAAAKRVHEHRRRKRMGLRCLTVRVNDRRRHQATIFNAAHCGLLFLPDREGFGEGAVPRQTLFYGQDGSAAIDVADWDVEPRAFLEHLNIALLVSTGSRKLDYKDTIRRRGSDLSERSTWLLLGLFHQNSRHAGNAATRKIYRQIKFHFDGVVGRQGVVDRDRCGSASMQRQSTLHNRRRSFIFVLRLERRPSKSHDARSFLIVPLNRRCS
jgi:hypothetical protein